MINQPEINMSKISKLLVSKKKEQQRAELESDLRKERHNRVAWREAFVPGYFDSEWGRAYVAKQKRELNNVTSGAHVMSQDMVEESRCKEANKESNETNATSTTNNATNNFLQMSENDFVMNDENVRPANEHFDSETNNANKSSIDDLSSTKFAG